MTFFDVFVMLTDASVEIVQQGSNGQQHSNRVSLVNSAFLHISTVESWVSLPDAKKTHGLSVPYAVPIIISPAAEPTGNPPITQLLPVPNVEAYVANVPNIIWQPFR
jgi:hypothetical protein